MEVKKEKLGSIVFIKSLGFSIQVKKDHADLLYRNGMDSFLDGVKNDLVPLEKRKIGDLRKMAKLIDGYQDSMKKNELIELIQHGLPES